MVRNGGSTGSTGSGGSTGRNGGSAGRIGKVGRHKMKELESSIQFLPGVGPKRAELISKELGISTFGELLRFYPHRYIDRS
ncbi:MAG: hypothetical protein PUF43_01550, partial [Bacteroidales bacterium]|nr:hypothetical protein [Bacteroidales bacterium]